MGEQTPLRPGGAADSPDNVPSSFNKKKEFDMYTSRNEDVASIWTLYNPGRGGVCSQASGTRPLVRADASPPRVVQSPDAGDIFIP